MEEKDFIAHVRKNDDEAWAVPHFLSEHLEGTAKLAEAFAAKFDSGEWGRAAGIAHDAGKGRLEWQNYLRQKSGFFDEEAHLEGKYGKIPHAIHGAKLVEEVFGKSIGRVLAYSIAGHHAGLPDYSNAEGAGQSSLQFQLKQVKDINKIDPSIKNRILSATPPSLPRRFSSGIDLSLWIRMLYSCLVDADFLDTEHYMNLDQASMRSCCCTVEEMLQRFNAFINNLEKTSADTPVNRIRRNIKEKCVQMGKEDMGIFSLTVPTGGGKTLSSLAFALEHAKKHNLERIIYVIPYTSIIEQNANVIRSALGDDQVIEHHSSIDEDESSVKSRLASENWDAPIVVTTSVQFYESLFAAKSSRCRKLHNIVNSVVILDEAQLIPIEYLNPILETIQLLADHYHVSFVISTATQPAVGERISDGVPFKGLKGIREIMGDKAEVEVLFKSLKRVEFQLPDDFSSPSSWEKIAEELQQYEQVLCIVSDRKSCRELYSLMPEGTYHLSALMCGQHRSEKIEEIKQKLKNREPIRVISTQLVEAGVDVDFPVVYRSLAGLDSIAQAAGRCNREGKSDSLGKVVLFIAPKKLPLGILRKAGDTTKILLVNTKQDILQNSLFEKYFTELYWKANSLDNQEIILLLSRDIYDLSIYFRTAANKFRIIDDSKQKTVFVRYGLSDILIDQLKHRGPDRSLLRKLQRYTVNIYNEDFYQMLNRNAIEEIQPKIYALSTNLDYSKDVGLLVEQTLYDPELLFM